MGAHDVRSRRLGVKHSSPLKFLTLAKASEMSIFHAHFQKAIEDLRGVVVIAGSLTMRGR